VLWLRCYEGRGSSRRVVRVRIHSLRRNRCRCVVQVYGVCIRVSGARRFGSLRTRLGVVMAGIAGSGNLAKFVGMRLAKALPIVRRNGTNVDREVFRRWCVSAIQRTLESGADSGRLLLATVRPRSGWENIEQLLCRTCEENELIAILVKSVCDAANAGPFSLTSRKAFHFTASLSLIAALLRRSNSLSSGASSDSAFLSCSSSCWSLASRFPVRALEA
jgi:hypothetical protein